MDMPHRHLNVAQLYNMDTRLSAMIITTASSCLQCNSEIVYLFKRITNEAIPKFIKDPKLQRRADTLVNGMASNFFKDYAVKHFAGIIEQNFLDALMIFRNHTTMKFKHGLLAYHNKACSPTQCGWLKTDVFSCTNCVTVKPSCLSRSVCMGLHFKDKQRIALVVGEEETKSAMLSDGLYNAAILAFILLIVMSLLPFLYWIRKKSLAERTMLV
ncbi:izumo sperm-egg fusion protein 2 isoform 2-T2 [Anomaloglossus baeobatrachus]|uniref:izumo sperm-egg fusion protein 2 isoform X2 n=1 Tax=Anomaloglossus baeobatrachus TaxID=238106 RepID=UPI003F5005EB